MRAEREDRLFGSVQGVGVASQRGQSRNSVATGPWRQALTPPFLLLRPAGFCYADGGGRLSQRRRGCWGRRRRRKRREESTARATSLPFQRHIVQETKPGRAGAHTRTHGRRPGRLLSVLCAVEKAAQLCFAEDAELSLLPAQLRTKPRGEPSRGTTFFLRCLPRPETSHSIPSPALNSDLSPPHPLGVSRGQRPGAQGVSSGLESTFQHFGQRPGLLGFQDGEPAAGRETAV